LQEKNKLLREKRSKRNLGRGRYFASGKKENIVLAKKVRQILERKGFLQERGEKHTTDAIKFI